ncbi:MAG: Na/Pi cotransporter family protein [Deltaproteobacteria bacterium]|nr:Na/Pi cotransporter family protein [Deltaproteobacteria bacterium]
MPFTLLEMLGAIGVFLIGMKLMSEALQKLAGARLKSWLGRITSNRLRGVLTGFGVTSVLQSSSATTVLVVSFVTAGLLTLTQAIGVIMGANIGTTVTGWLVALLGFKVKITAFALPAVGIGFAMTFLRNARRRQTGEALIGFGLLFLGLALMKDAMPSLSGPEQLAWVTPLTGYGVLSAMFFVLVGTVLTMLLQSSSATMTLTLTMAAVGFLPYDMAAAMVLGENIGTTATANIAAIGTRVDARRAARAHLVFNLVGATWAILLMWVFLFPLVDALVPGNPNVDFAAIQGDEAAISAGRGVVTAHIAMFHTSFNVINTLVMLPFVNHLARLVTWWIPEKAATERRTLDYLSTALIETPELFLLQVGKEVEHVLEVVREMFTDTVHVLTHPEEDLGELVVRTLNREDDVDGMEYEITRYLGSAVRSATSVEAARKALELRENIHRLERIADHCATLTRIADRIHQEEQGLGEQDIEDIEHMSKEVERALDHVGRYLAGQGSLAEAEAIEDNIDEMRRQLRAKDIERMRRGEAGLVAGLAMLDILTEFEEIGDRATGIVRLKETTALM